jgi:GSH-dependent disulfide-bond oxidoreductase
MQLWTAATPNGWKVSIMLEELIAHGIDLPEVETHYVDLMGGQQFGDEFMHLNPNQRIPVLVDGDRSIMESCAILHYLAEKYQTSLLPSDERRWDVIPWVYWQAANVGPAFGNRQSYVRYINDVEESAKAHPLERFLQEARRLSAVLEQQLQNQNFVCGNDITIADIAIYPWIRGWKWSKVDMTDRPNILAWIKTMRARPGVEKGLAYGARDGEVDRWSKETRERYATRGAALSKNPNET